MAVLPRGSPRQRLTGGYPTVRSAVIDRPRKRGQLPLSAVAGLPACSPRKGKRRRTIRSAQVAPGPMPIVGVVEGNEVAGNVSGVVPLLAGRHPKT